MENSTSEVKENKKKQRVWIIVTYIAISVLGFITLGYFLNNYVNGVLDNTENIGIDIVISGTFVLIAFELYFILLFLVALIGYFISKFSKKLEFIAAFKYLSWIYFILWVLFTAYWIVVPN